MTNQTTEAVEQCKNCFTPEAIEQANAHVANLQANLDITNADHIALWLEEHLTDDTGLGWLACRIIEAHEAALRAQLTAATRRAEQLEAAVAGHDLIPEGDHAKAIVRAEQAERMLIERDGSILMLKAFFHDCNGALVKAVRALTEIANFKPTYHRKPKSFQTPLIAQQALYDMASIDIRSAASGEQG